MFLTVKEALEVYKNGSVSKASLPFGQLTVKSILAGLLIGMGAAASSVAAHSIPNVGLARLAAAVVFPVGLMMVIILGAELFTGDCLMVLALPEKKISMKQYIHTLAVVFLGNWIGATFLSIMIYFSGQLNYSDGMLGAYTIKVALGKVSLSAPTAVVSGILCNILVCAAVLMAICAKDIAGKLLVSFFVIMLFVTAGFEHCVANMYYITAGMLAKSNPAYAMAAMQQYGLTEADLAMLNIKTFVIDNLVPVTIGNIIGGAVLLGLSLYYMNMNTDALAKKEGRTIQEVKRKDEYRTGYVASVSD